MRAVTVRFVCGRVSGRVWVVWGGNGRGRGSARGGESGAGKEDEVGLFDRERFEPETASWTNLPSSETDPNEAAESKDPKLISREPEEEYGDSALAFM